MRELVITCKAKQNQILKQISKEKKISPFSFLTKQELLERLYFRYDKRAIYYLVQTYHVSVENAIIYLDNMYYIEEKEYQSEKLRQLKEMKNALETEHLLIHDALFPFYLKKYTVVYDEACMTKFDEKVIKDLEKITNVTVVKEKANSSYSHPVYACANMEEEIEFVANSIIKLYQDGISFQQIKIVNLHSEYEYDVKRIFAWYYIPVDIKEKRSIYGTVLATSFLDLLGTIPNDEIIEQLKKQFTTEQDIIILHKIVDIINEYNWYDGYLSFLKEFIIYDLKKSYLPNPTMASTVEAVTLEEVQKDDYVFFLGFNTDTVPLVLKDEAYITNALVSELPCSTTFEQNKLQKMDTIKRINEMEHCTITYKKKGMLGEYYPASILSDINVQEHITLEEQLSLISYSKTSSSMQLGRKLDEYTKYGIKSTSISPLMNALTPFPYRQFHHQYTGILSATIMEYLKEKNGLVLSYTNMDKYMKCGFYYYLDCILKLDDYQETFMTLIGNYFHRMLEIAREPSFDFVFETKQYFAGREFTFKEQFLLEKLAEELQEVIKVVLYQESLSKHQLLSFEERIAVDYQYPIPVTMKGFIDKVMALEKDNLTYVSLIDYKTGGFDIGLDDCIHGFHLQLPIYAYLIKHSEKLRDSILTGLYIAPILPSETLAKVGKEKQEQKIQDMRLVGYSTNDVGRLEAFDTTYEDSRMIKGMKVTSKGFGPYSKVLSDTEFEALIELTESKIKETITHILQGDFAIDPKYLREKNVSCRFCPYHDVCYHDYNDYVYLKEQDYHTFLGGD